MIDKEKKYNYNDWWKGKVVFNVPFIINEKEKCPILVTLSDFEDADVAKIEEKQKEIFFQKVNQKYKELYDIFLRKYKKSELKKQLLKIHVEGVNKMLRGKIKNEEIINLNEERIIFFKHTNVPFTEQQIEDIHDYYNNSILKGNIYFDFIQSPNSIYHSVEFINVLAHSLWNHYKWLLMSLKKIESKQNTTKVEKTIEQDKEPQEPQIPQNPHSKIFKNGFAYQMFIELKDKTAITDNINADFAFIFHKMRDNEYINKKVKHREFIDFLNENFFTKMVDVKFPFRNPKYKEKIYSKILEKYEPLIKSVQ